MSESEPIPTEDVDAYHNVNPTNIQSVHVDKALVAIDLTTETATVTLLSMHPVPKIKSPNQWAIQDVVWDIVGELKIPIRVMMGVCGYFLHQLTGYNVADEVNKYIREHPEGNPKNRTHMTYGPMD
jgi:hypothetical protein